MAVGFSSWRIWGFLSRSGTEFDPRGLLYPLSDLLFLYAMGMYRREAFVERRRSFVRVPLVIGMGSDSGADLERIARPAWLPSIFLDRARRDELLIFWSAFASFFGLRLRRAR